jgi:stringent starvation protein B
MHEWMVDNGFTPHLVVDANQYGVRVPVGHVKDGKIVLNVSPTATRGLSLGNDVVSFEARFGGVPERLVIPVMACVGIYARETGQGMIFGEEGAPPPGPEGGEPPKPPAGGDDRKAKAKPKLKVVK